MRSRSYVGKILVVKCTSRHESELSLNHLSISSDFFVTECCEPETPFGDAFNRQESIQLTGLQESEKVLDDCSINSTPFEVDQWLSRGGARDLAGPLVIDEKIMGVYSDKRNATLVGSSTFHFCPKIIEIAGWRYKCLEILQSL